MLYRTHLVIGLFAALLFLSLVSNPLSFLVITLVASLFPDIDTAFSKVGRNMPAKFVQVFTTHRGMIHSVTLAIIISGLLSIFIPKLAFGFFLGYSSHLLSDSFTKMGITPFWPYSRVARGKVKTGGIMEKGIFLTFVVLDLFLIFAHLL